MWPSSGYTPSSLPSRYRPTGSLSSTGSSFNYTPSSSLSYGSTRLGSSGLSGSSSKYTPNSTSSSSTSRDPYLSASTIPSYNINQSPYASSTTSNNQQQPELYSSFNNPSVFNNSSGYASRLSPGPLSSRLSPSRLSPGPSTSSNYAPQKSTGPSYTRESSPNTQQSKFFNRRNSSVDLAMERRGSILDPLAGAGKRSDSISDPNAIPSVKDSWASGYLRRRKEAQKEEYPEPIIQPEKPKGVFAAKPSPVPIPVTKVKVKEPPPAESIANQKEFMNRLLAAHSAVDDLLSKRGLKTDDENKFLRHYEWVPVIEEELAEERLSPRAIRRRHQTVSPMRSISSESDSGLSMESSENNDNSLTEIDAGDCGFECGEEADEFCGISVLMSGTETAVEYNVKREEKPAKVVEKLPEKAEKLIPKVIEKSPPKILEKMPESKSTKKLVRQKLNFDEVFELHAKLQEKVELPESKSVKKLVRQSKTTEELELHVLKIVKPIIKEEPFQIAFSKCAVAKCRTKSKGEEFNEKIKLKEEEVLAKPEPKSASKLIVQNSKIAQIDLKIPKLKEVLAKQDPKSASKLIVQNSKIAQIDLKVPKPITKEEPLQIAFSKCAIAKCRPKCQGETFTETVKLKPIPKQQKIEEKSISPINEVQLKKAVKIQEPNKPEEIKMPELKPINKLKKQEVKTEVESPKKPVKKLLKRQQTEPTLSTNRRQVGKLTIEESNLRKTSNDSKLSQLSKPSRHLLDSLSLMSMANRTMNAKFRSLDESKNRGMAEISVQHCSFYEVHKGLIEPKEKALRIHLRLTARSTVTALSVQKVLPTNERTHRLVLRIADRRDILREVQEERLRELTQSPKLPGKLKIVEFSDKPLPPKKPLIFTDTSVKLLQEKLKRQQANAELQSLRGNLKRVPRTRLVSAGKSEDAMKKKEEKKLPKRKIVKKIVKKSKIENPTVKISDTSKEAKFDDIYLSKVESKSSLSLPIEKQQISQCPSSSSIASSGNRSSRSKPTFMNKKFMGNWERRIIDEFRRNRNIPVLHAIYRQIFCLKCKICPTLGAPRGPHRAHFVRSGSEIDEDEEEPITEATEAPIPEPEVVAEEPPPAEEKGDEEEEEEGDAGGDEEIDDNASEAPQDSLAPEEERKVRRSIVPEEPDPTTLTEAQVAILEAKKRQQEADELRAMDADSRRKAELQHIEEELVALKQRQEERRREREVEEAKEAERRKEEEQKRKVEELARKEKMEAEKNRRAEEKIKRQEQAGSFAGFGEKNDGRNFTVGVGDKSKLEKKEKKSGLTKEQKEENKRNYMSIVNKPVDVSNLLPNDIKAKIKQVHAKLVRLEAEKYDLEKRGAMQEYDLKELAERESQKSRNKALAAGVEIEDAEAGKGRPPKVNVASKFDRQVDRRSYTDKFTLFENPNVQAPKSIVRGSGRPPPEWGRKQLDEIEALRKVIEPPKYVEIVKAEGDAAKPPVEVIPMQIPTEDFDPSLAQKETSKSTRPFGDEKIQNDGPVSPSGGETELEITEEPVDA